MDKLTLPPMERKRIIEPSNGSICMYKPREGKPYPVYIIDGQYLDSSYGRLSNFWHMRPIMEDLSLGEEFSTYGNFWECKQLEVVPVIKFCNTLGH